jgi:oxygen-independent coproporphyrinogen-3 oxidase
MVMAVESQNPAFEHMREALGAIRKVAFGPPHIYPMSAPRFQPSPGLERPGPIRGGIKLYVHIPFCNYACSFCFYAKRVGVEDATMERYVHAVVRELEIVEAGTQLAELFVGGGTPTTLPPRLLDHLLSGIGERLITGAGAIHTVEASPESLSDAHLDVLQSHSIGRMSMGIQSLDEHVLEGVRRRHTPGDALAAAGRILDRGFLLNCDLIYGLPGYSEEMFRADFEALVGAGIHSITVYNLRVNRQTPVAGLLEAGGPLDLAGLLRWRRFIDAVAADLGFIQTRWHTYKRPSRESLRHARAASASEGGDGCQLGVGASARSHLGHTIYRNHSHPATYADRITRCVSPVEDVLHLGPGDLKAMHVARTLGDGRALHLSTYADHFGTRFECEFASVLERMIAAGLIGMDEAEVRLTDSGRMVHDLIAEQFYPADAREWLDRQQVGSSRLPATKS